MREYFATLENARAADNTRFWAHALPEFPEAVPQFHHVVIEAVVLVDALRLFGEELL